MFVVFDLDDTLAITDHRQHLLEGEYETETERWNTFFDACEMDLPNEPIIEVLDALNLEKDKHRIEIWTGRSDRVRYETHKWLRAHVLHSQYLILRMRRAGDTREDWEIKSEWIDEHGKPDLVFDDRNKVVNWWRERGVVCCQVKESTF